MKTTIILHAQDVTTLKTENAKRAEAKARFLEDNPHIQEENFTSWEKEFYNPIPWNQYRADSDTLLHSINPLVFHTHKVDLFPENQGTVEFTCNGEMLMNALETSRFHSGGYLHFLVPSVTTGYDYAICFSNVGFQRKHEPGIIVNKSDIDPDKTYAVELIGGWNYVFIKEVRDGE